ncbi:pyridoxal phosphate-dependent transferase [Geopyxis carbonaria]|nr:pyridoxal phosphate-dependent transferase [Geopyxis carbonaria]
MSNCCHLSIRIRSNLETHNAKETPTSKHSQNPYHPSSNPHGIVSLGVAQNEVMHAELSSYLCHALTVMHSDLGYCSSDTGSPTLKTALADFINTKFCPRKPISASNVLLTAGGTSVSDQLAWAIADAGDAILVASPLYTGFEKDFGLRSGVESIPVDCGRWDDMFCGTDMSRYDDALRDARGRAKALLVCNPHNPTGRCYSYQTLKALISWARLNGLVYISDEIYATSVHSPHNGQGFVSALSLSEDVHVVYGMSKDFCCNGFRVGAMISHDQGLHQALTSVARLAWPSSLSQRAWLKMLDNPQWLDLFITTNNRRLRERYEITTRVLIDAGIPFVQGATAGFFVWVDIRKFMKRGMEPEIAGNELMETLLRGDGRMQGGGVYVGSSDKFLGEPGWCRLVFSGEERAFKEGLRRFVSILLREMARLS